MSFFRHNHWEWVDEGTPDKKPRRGRIYYNSIRFISGADGHERIFNLGDTVIMNGAKDETWTAQIIELFQAREDDDDLRQILLHDSKKRVTKQRYELMRVTIRWFYNYQDMNKVTLKRSAVPKPVKGEIYFSDHIEKNGYNDVQVIEGRAWLFNSKRTLTTFENDPPKEFLPHHDRLKVVRCFVNSQSPDLVVRELERNELQYLLQNPSLDTNLYENARARLFGSAGAVLKGTGRKRSKYSRQSVDISNDLDDSADDEIRPNRKQSSARKAGRRKVIVNDPSDDDDDTVDNDDIAYVPNDDITPAQPRDPAEDTEVLDLIAEFNQNANEAELPTDDLDVNLLFGEDDITPVTSNKKEHSRKSLKSRRLDTETIVIDELEGLGKDKRKEKKKNPYPLPQRELTNRSAKQSLAKKASSGEKLKNVFKPTGPSKILSKSLQHKRNSVQLSPDRNQNRRGSHNLVKDTIDLDQSPKLEITKKNDKQSSPTDDTDVPELIILDSSSNYDSLPIPSNDKPDRATATKKTIILNTLTKVGSAQPDRMEISPTPENAQKRKDIATTDGRSQKRKFDDVDEIQPANEPQKRSKVGWNEQLDQLLQQFQSAFDHGSSETQAVLENLDFIVHNILEKFSTYSEGPIADMPDNSLHAIVKDVMGQLVKAS